MKKTKSVKTQVVVTQKPPEKREEEKEETPNSKLRLSKLPKPYLRFPTPFMTSLNSPLRSILLARCWLRRCAITISALQPASIL